MNTQINNPEFINLINMFLYQYLSNIIPTNYLNFFKILLYREDTICLISVYNSPKLHMFVNFTSLYLIKQKTHITQMIISS